MTQSFELATTTSVTGRLDATETQASEATTETDEGEGVVDHSSNMQEGLFAEATPFNGTTARADNTPKLEFVHITKTGGSAVELAASKAGITWGICHFQKRKNIGDGCENPDWTFPHLPRRKRGWEGEYWHTPPHWLEPNPYRSSPTFTIVRDPYERVVSEYYCRFYGFHRQEYRGKKKLRRGDLLSGRDEEWIQQPRGKPVFRRPSVEVGEALNEDLYGDRRHGEERVIKRNRVGRRDDDQKAVDDSQRAEKTRKELAIEMIRWRREEHRIKRMQIGKRMRMVDLDSMENNHPPVRRRLLADSFDPVAPKRQRSASKTDSPETLNRWVKKRIKEKIKEGNLTGHMTPQHHFIFHKGKQRIDHILRYETLDMDFRKLMKKYGLSLELTKVNPGHIDSAGKRMTPDDLNEESIQLINELFELDFKLLNYPMKQARSWI